MKDKGAHTYLTETIHLFNHCFRFLGKYGGVGGNQ